MVPPTMARLPGLNGGRPQPATKRGRNTRAELIRAARTVFERDGYLGAKVTDIAAEARVATGTFYTYFSSKAEILSAVLEIALEEMLYPDVQYSDEQKDPWGTIEAATRAYLEAYQRNADIMRVFEQASTIDEGFRAARLERITRFAERNARQIRRFQENGQADPTIDATNASIALSSMVSRAAYFVFALGYPVEDFEGLVKTVSTLWANALRLEVDSYDQQAS